MTKEEIKQFLKDNPDIAPISSPQLKANGSNNTDEFYELLFEIMPSYPVPDLNGVDIELPLCCVDDRDVDLKINDLREEMSSYEQSDQPVSLGHRVLLDTTVNVNGEVFADGTKKDFLCKVNGGQDIIKEFEDIIYGMKQGETKVADVAVPEDYYMKDIAGKTVEFVVSVKKVEEQILPSIEEYIQKIKKNLLLEI